MNPVITFQADRQFVESLILPRPGSDEQDIAVLLDGAASPVARIVYERAGATGKRVQALGGAKNYIIVMPDCDRASREH